MRFAAVRMVANGTSRQIPKPRIYCGIDAKQTFVDKRSRPNLQRMTPERSLAQRRTVETGFLFSDPPPYPHTDRRVVAFSKIPRRRLLELETVMPESQSRRLAAILAADIAGYSALMGADETRTVHDLKGHQAVVLPMIGEFGGHIIDTAGDGILAEFPSVVNAVKCAVAIQSKMAERNVAIELDRRMQFRICINIGEIIYDQARIYGEGINVAARLENIAEPGGICISSKVHEEISGRIDLAYQDIGDQQLKNIARPVRAYRVHLDSVAPTLRPCLRFLSYSSSPATRHSHSREKQFTQRR